MKTPLLSDITNRLSSISETPALDASVLLAHIIDKPRTWILSHPELTLTTVQQKKLDISLVKLESGVSFPYVLGHWEFFGLKLTVTPDVLIPRPETELLVDKAIAWLSKNPHRRSVADIGTGSGAIAVSIAANVQDVSILATDISKLALQVAKQNAKTNNAIHKINFVECDLLPEPSKSKDHITKIDLLCANLPYIPTKTLHKLSVFGREPTLALDGGENGFDLIERLLKQVPEYLAPKGVMLLEFEATLGRQAMEISQRILSNANIQIHKDLTGRDRLLEIHMP